MAGSASYGFLFGIAFVILARVAPQPAGSIVLWLLVAIHLACGSVVCWRRTALPCATAAIAINSATSSGFAVLAALGQVYPDIAPEYLVLAGLGVLSGAVLFFVESRLNRDKWARWKQHAARQTLWDILTVRHIPDPNDLADGIRRAP
jgi:hypothetical protein